MFVLPTRASFFDAVSGIFSDERTKTFRDQGFLDHQARVASFVAPDTPYRGLVLIHGLGTGKTSAAAAAAIAWVGPGGGGGGGGNGARRKIRVITPAALRGGFAAEFKQRGISATTASTSSGADLEFVSQNGLTPKTIAALTLDGKGNALDDSLIIVDEAHNVSRTLAGDEAGTKPGPARALYDLVRTAKRAKVLLLTATPIHNHAAEIAYLANMVHGPVIESTTRFLAPLQPAEVAAVETALAADGRVDAFTVTRTDVRLRLVGDPRFRIADRASGQVDDSGAANGGTATATATATATLASLAESVPSISIGPHAVREHELLPTERALFDAMFVRADGAITNRGILSRRLTGIVSSFERRDGTDSAEYPRIRRDHLDRVTMGARQANEYARARGYEQSLESKSIGGDDEISVYRYYSRIASNFVFPVGPRGRRAFKFEDRDTSAEAYAAATQRAIVETHASGFWLDDAALASHAPKFARVWSRVSRRGAGKCVVFSAFREVEGIGLFGELLLARGWRRVTVNKGTVEVRGARPDASGPCFAAPQPGEAEGQALLAMFNGRSRSSGAHAGAIDQLAAVLGGIDEQSSRNLRGETVKLLLLSRSGAEGVNLSEVRQMHILEPHWNAVQLEQAIGRAVRLGSHARLPLDERDVSIYRYMATLPAAAAVPNEDAAVFELDKWVSTDEHVAASAMRKRVVALRVLDIVRAAAVDCTVNAPDDARACYRPPADSGSGHMVPARATDDIDDPLGDGRRLRVRTDAGTTRDVIVFANSSDVFDAQAFDGGKGSGGASGLVPIGYIAQSGRIVWAPPITPHPASDRSRASRSRTARTP